MIGLVPTTWDGTLSTLAYWVVAGLLLCLVSVR